MTIAEMREKLYSFLNTADEKTVKALYTLLEKNIEVPNKDYTPSEDNSIVEEMEQRYEEALSGRGVGVYNAENEEETYSHWDDPEFVAEMERRYEDVMSGKAKLVTLDEVEEKARMAAAKLKNNK